MRIFPLTVAILFYYTIAMKCYYQGSTSQSLKLLKILTDLEMFFSNHSSLVSINLLSQKPVEAQTFRKKYNFQGIKRLTGLPRNRQQSVKLSFRGHERPSHYQYKMTLKGHRSAKEKRKKKANAVLIKSHFKKFRLKLK